MNDNSQTSTHIRKGQINSNNLSIEVSLSDRNKNQQFNERVERDLWVREGVLNFKSDARLNDPGMSCESLRKFDSLEYSPVKHNKDEVLTVNSAHSLRSYKSTTNEEILSKYQITSIMKRKHQEQLNQCKTCKLIGKIILIVLLFPFSLIWILASCIIDKRQQKRKIQLKNNTNSSRKQPRKQKRQPNICTRCIDSIQECCATCFCYYLCCQCCEDCYCCTKCCRKVQKCLQCLCENSLTEGCEDCLHCCLIKNCERFCSCVCCLQRTHEKLDTIERLERMSERASDRSSVRRLEIQ